MTFIVPNIISVIANDGLADLGLVSLEPIGDTEHQAQTTKPRWKKKKNKNNPCIFEYSFNAIHIRDMTPMEIGDRDPKRKSAQCWQE